MWQKMMNVNLKNVKCESFTIICVYSLLVYENKYYLQIYLDDCVCKFVDKQIIDCLDDNPFRF